MRESVQRPIVPEGARRAKPEQPPVRVLDLQRAFGNQAVTRMLARRTAPPLPAGADNLKRFRDGAPRLRALAGRPAPAVDAQALDLAPALAWLVELADTLTVIEPI